MLRLEGIGYRVGGRSGTELLGGVGLEFGPGHFGAVVGPSGCGKSTLLRVIAGLSPHTEGEIHWRGRVMDAGHDFHPCELGYVPQFSIFHDELTAGEILRAALQLRVAGLGRRRREERLREVATWVGLEEILDRRAGVLSGGQRRRLGLAVELASDPRVLLCDEVTSGLDPKSEDEIVELLAGLAQAQGRIVLHVTHSLRHCPRYDSVTVLYGGCAIFQGPPGFLREYFEIGHPEDLFTSLGDGTPQQWRERWDLCAQEVRALLPAPAPEEEPEETGPPAQPGGAVQAGVLLARRWKLFFRDRGQLWLQVSLLFIFPCLVVLFALHGLPQIRNLSLELESDIVARLRETLEFTAERSRTGSLVSGLVMFQVILLSLMGSNNASREVAAERRIFEKEKLSGVRVGSYLASKCLFLAVLVAAQSAWMAVFVKMVCRLPGDLALQALLLGLANAAMTATCLAISSWARSAEQASLISIYLVGFQLPLSGAVLALPEWLGQAIRPLIAAYWSWSGVLQTMKETSFYDLAAAITSTPLSAWPLCLWVMFFHAIVAAGAAHYGCARSAWERL